MNNWELVDVNDNSGVAKLPAIGIRPSLTGEGQYIMVKADGTTKVQLNIVSNSNIFPIEADSEITNTDGSAVDGDLLYFIYWG